MKTDSYKLVVVRNNDTIVYTDGWEVARTTYTSKQSSADCEAMQAMRQRMEREGY